MKNYAKEIWNSVRRKSWRMVVDATDGPGNKDWETLNSALSNLVWSNTYRPVMNPLDELLDQLEQQRRQLKSETDDGRLPRER